MFESLMLSILTVFLGILPSLIGRNFKSVTVISVIGLPLSWIIYYNSLPALVSPSWGIFSVLIVIYWLASSVLMSYDRGDTRKTGMVISISLISLFVVLMSVGAFGGSGCIRSVDYAKLIGEVEKREWTKDIQPKDPKHVRLVPLELAYYLATKQLGEVKGAVGSQFQINKEHLTLQLVNNELWYVAPLDYKSFSVWTAADCAPGYVMIHGEDPKTPVVVKVGMKFHFMPGAYFGKNLERHIWKESMMKYALTDYSFEIDDSGNPWWVVSAYKPTIMWWGEKTYGVYIINPVNGDTKFYPIGEIPSWVDRVIPQSFVKHYAEMRGTYSGGWRNSVWGEENVTEPEEPTLIYGSDGKPYWATGITSKNETDTSLIGILYTDVQTGKSIEYHAIGGTEKAIIQLVDNKVSFRKLHGTCPVLYNIYGVMTGIVPILGESHSFQGVAMVDVANMQLVVGDDSTSTARQYQKLIMSGSAQKLAPEKSYELQKMSGVVNRISQEVVGNETVYYIHIDDFPHILSGSSELSPKLRMMEKGDKVNVEYIQSEEDVIPLANFDLPSLILVKSSNQVLLEQKVAERLEQVKAKENSLNACGEVENMSDAKVQGLMKLKKKTAK